MSYTFHVPYPKIFPERSLRLSLESPNPMTTFRLHILQATLVSGSEVRSSGTPLCWFHIWFKPVPVVLDIALFHELWLWLLVRRQPPTAYPWAAHGLCLVSHHWPSLGYQPLWLLVSLGTVALFSTFAQLHYQGFLKQNCRTFSTFLLSCECHENQKMFLGSHLKCPWTVSSNWDALRTSCVPPWGDRSAWRINVRDSVSISQKRRKCKVCVTSSLVKCVASPVALGIQRGANVWILCRLGKECASIFQGAVCLLHCILGVSESRKGLWVLQSGTQKPETLRGVFRSLHNTQASTGGNLRCAQSIWNRRKTRLAEGPLNQSRGRGTLAQ